MMVLLMMWWRKATTRLIGCVTSVATCGVQKYRRWSAAKLAAHSVPRRLGNGTGARGLHVILFWLNGIRTATQYGETILTAPLCKATSRSSGSAITVQQGNSTVGLLDLVIGLVDTGAAVPSVLGTVLADATPCRRSTPTQLQSGIIARTKVSPVTTLLAHITWLGGPAPSVAAGSRPSIRAQVRCIRGLQGCNAFSRDRLQMMAHRLTADHALTSIWACEFPALEVQVCTCVLR